MVRHAFGSIRRSSNRRKRFDWLGNTARQLALGESLEPRPVLAVASGDFDADEGLTLTEIELLSAEVRRGSNDLAFEFNPNKSVNSADRVVWVENIVETYLREAHARREEGGDPSDSSGRAGG